MAFPVRLDLSLLVVYINFMCQGGNTVLTRMIFMTSREVMFSSS
jgi:hypothetical protein